MLTSADVSIVMPNWNGLELLKKYFRSVKEAADKAEIILVDDVSEDNSVRYIKDNYPDVNLVVKKTHDGFSSTVNAGVGRSNRDIVFLLNTDVVPNHDFLSHILPHFQDNRVFAVGCLEESKDKDGVVLRGRGVAEWSKGLFIHRRGEVDKNTTAWVSGGSGAFSRKLWNELGGLDPLFNPFYWEDIDLSYRALKAGYRLVFEKKSVVKHYHQVGAIRSQFTPAQVKRIAYRNQYIFIWKNLTDPPIIAEHFRRTFVEIVKAVLRRDIDFILGLGKALLLLPRITAGRNANKPLWRLSDKELSLH